MYVNIYILYLSYIPKIIFTKIKSNCQHFLEVWPTLIIYILCEMYNKTTTNNWKSCYFCFNKILYCTVIKRLSWQFFGINNVIFNHWNIIQIFYYNNSIVILSYYNNNQLTSVPIRTFKKKKRKKRPRLVLSLSVFRIGVSRSKRHNWYRMFFFCTVFL